MLNKELLRRRIDFIRQGSEVERWHTKKMLQVNDVGHHSFHVAWFAFIIYMSYAEKATNAGAQRVVMAALSHDLAEHVTGDIPGDFKRELHLREQFGSYEAKLFDEIGLNFWGDLSEGEARIIKFADMLDGLFFVISEAAFGNKRVGRIFRNYRAYVETFLPMNDTEAALVEYVDELWAHYAKGPVSWSVPVWGRTSHTEESMQDRTIMGPDERDGLVETLRREEAEGRATALPCGHARAEKEGRVWTCPDCGATRETYQEWQAGPQSNAPEQGDAGVPEQPADEPVDDVATSDIVPERPSSPANARQHGGDHYKGVGYEHWDLVLDTGMNYFQGCATKYVTRWRKHETGETNLLKAIHYVDKLQEAEEAGRIKPEGVHTVSDIVSFGVANGLNELELQVIKDIVGWRLDNARGHLERLRAGYTEMERTNTKSYYGQNS